MITPKTALTILSCQRAIAQAEEFLAEIGDRPGNLQLGIPSGRTSHWMHDVCADLSRELLAAFIQSRTKQLAEANETARKELA